MVVVVKDVSTPPTHRPACYESNYRKRKLHSTIRSGQASWARNIQANWWKNTATTTRWWRFNTLNEKAICHVLLDNLSTLGAQRSIINNVQYRSARLLIGVIQQHCPACVGVPLSPSLGIIYQSRARNTHTHTLCQSHGIFSSTYIALQVLAFFPVLQPYSRPIDLSSVTQLIMSSVLHTCTLFWVFVTISLFVCLCIVCLECHRPPPPPHRRRRPTHAHCIDFTITGFNCKRQQQQHKRSLLPIDFVASWIEPNQNIYVWHAE